jgi:uncharacterized alkaline shock family protein YloU
MFDAGDFKIRAGIPELIAGIALSGVEGAWGTGIRHDHPEDRKRRKSLSKGIKVEVEEGNVVFDVDVNMEYGKDFIAVARTIQAVVSAAVSSMIGWDVAAVNVNVVGVNAL